MTGACALVAAVVLAMTPVPRHVSTIVKAGVPVAERVEASKRVAEMAAGILR